MLEPQKMDRVLVVGTRDVMESTINKLHELNLLHLEDYVEEEGYFHIGKPLKAATPLSEKLLKLRSIKSYLGTKEVIPKKGNAGEGTEGTKGQPRDAGTASNKENVREERAGVRA